MMRIILVGRNLLIRKVTDSGSTSKIRSEDELPR